MLNNKQIIEQILEKGFTQLPVDDLTIARATKLIAQRSKELRNDNRPSLCQPSSKLLYALAATLVLICSFTYMQLNKRNVQFQSKVDQTQIDKQQSVQTSVLSYIGNTKSMSTDNSINTDEKSQVLIALGKRTKVILFENSLLNVIRADSMHIDIALSNGSIAVDITPGGSDTVAVKTTHGIFTQIGTRFSVHVDSLKGSKLEVFRGKVQVTDSSGTDLPVLYNQEWESSQKLKVFAANRNKTEINEIQKTFNDNKITKRLIWNTYFSQKDNLKPDLSKKYSQSDKKVNCSTSIIKTIQAYVNKENYQKIDSIIAQLQDPFVADTVYETLQSIIERNVSLFKFSKANRLLDCIIEGKPLKMQKRENAWLRRYFLCKENINSSSADKLKLINHYRMLFPQGTIGDDILAESIQLKLLLHKYTEAVLEMEKLFSSYPQSIHCKDYCYIYASTLRNHLKMIKPSLNAYKNYVSKYPNEKYEEDALYWIIKLSYKTEDRNSFISYKKIYLEKYSTGKWIEAVQAINSDKGRR